MRIGLLSVFVISGLGCGPALAQTAYGTCPLRAEVYQQRYLSNGRTSDLVCMQEALERELGGSGPASAYDCPRTSQHYQDSYLATGNASDLVCMQEALERELR